MPNVVWVGSGLCAKICGHFAAGQKVASENDLHSIDELRQLVGR